MIYNNTDYDKDIVAKESSPICNILNEAMTLDRPAITSLLRCRIPCNEGIVIHPDILVNDEEGYPTLTVLGLVNGICIRLGLPRVAIEVYDDGKLGNFITTNHIEGKP